MLTNKKTLAKLRKIEQRYSEMRFERIADVPMEICETRDHFRQEPARDAGMKWRSAPPGTRWGGNWITAWLRGGVRLPKACDGKKVFLRARTGGETLLIVDGVHRGVFDEWHPVVLMTMKGAAGRTYRLSLEAYSGHSFPGDSPDDRGTLITRKSRLFEGAELLVEREDVSAFVFDLQMLNQLVSILDENSLRRSRIASGLAKVYQQVDAMPQETGEASWRPKLAKAREIMRPLLQAKNGSTAPWFGLIGHSHMDTAWCWPLAETWRKCARTFSSVLNLMEQYPEFMFIQSSPCHTEVIRKEYPGIFERMQKMVAAGRWEPNGGMWVEPDCNVPSGESFVRQLLVGQNATREMFGYTSDTLWLPDVFGYSAALPQILRGANIQFFCTTKISWNDTTRFPYDTFIWKGIDQTPVLAHFHFLHCPPDPKTLTAHWNLVQHKDIEDRRLCPFGFGDGGGGPTAEMLEVARRVKDLEGCPRARYMTVSDFMKSIRDELTDLPEWAGELYLETHRGTLTSIGKTKRGNRQAELALREAEFLSTLAALRGAEYPAAALGSAWKRLLTNQFHDILPGSSIAEVNDEAARDFSQCISDAHHAASAALKVLAGPPAPSPSFAGSPGGSPAHASLMVVNSLSWDRDGEMVLNAAPQGTAPADSGIASQWIEDIEGTGKLVVKGLDLPALGAAVVQMTQAPAAGQSPFEIAPNKLETPHAVVRFDETGRIVSFLDKASGREIVRPGGALNTFRIGEDVPEVFDNWDIDRDQAMKMQIDARLVRRELVANGPLQLRLRSEYEIGSQSTLIQDMVFHSTTPQVDFETMVHWADKHKLLKAEFDLNVLADSARHEIQFGHIERPTHTNLPQDLARFEVCAHKWTDLSENGFGVALLNDCKYGISVVGSRVGLSLLKSGLHPDYRGDEGTHIFTYSLLPHACGFSVESVVRPAYELNVPPAVFKAGPSAKGFDGLLSLDAPNVIVECVKWAEKGDAFVVRFYEAGKTGGKVSVRFHTRVQSVSEINLLEESPRKLRLRNNTVDLFMRPFEIKTLCCTVGADRTEQTPAGQRRARAAGSSKRQRQVRQ